MLNSHSKIGSLSTARSISPPRRKSIAQAEPKRDTVDLSASHAQEKPSFPLGKVLTTALLATTALTGTAAAAQTTPPTDPPTEKTVVSEQNCCQESEVDLSKEETPTQETPEKMKFGVTGSFVNDNMPNFLTGPLGTPQTTTPSGKYFDDDGWTAELRLEANWQNETSEYVLGGRLMMATENGSYDPLNTSFSGKRTDVGELVFQRNERVELDSKTTLDYGVGGGFQAIGNLGGEGVQRWWHQSGPFGGRTGDALQGNQMTEGFRVMPLITGGVQVQHQLNDHLGLTSGLQASVPMGQGLGVVGMNAGVKGNLGPVTLELGGKLDGSWSNADELSFMEVDGVRPGAYGSLELDTKKFGSLYTKVETGGFRNEPQLSVGIRIGLGGRSRLNPFR